MDTRIKTPLFELILPGAWTRAMPEPGLTTFRSPSGSEQLSISSTKVREPLTRDEQPDTLRAFVQVRRDAEARLAPASALSDAIYLDAPPRAMFAARDAARNRLSATIVLRQNTGFLVLYLESVGGGTGSFEDLVGRLSTACAMRTQAVTRNTSGP